MNNSETKKINCIEGLRTIGWIGIFLCHFRYSMLPNLSLFIDKTPLSFFYSGNPYVRMFFVISGFVLSYKYFNFDISLQKIPKEMIRRYFRLMPLIFLFSLIIYIFMKLGFLKNLEVAEITNSKTFLASFNNFEPSIFRCLKEALFNNYLIGDALYIGPLWTIKYEFLGSLLVILSVSIFKNQKIRYLFYPIFLLAYKSYFNYFIIGMIICDLYLNQKINIFISNHKLIKTILILTGFLLFSMTNITSEKKLDRIIFGIGIILFFIGFINSTLMENIFGNKLMQLGGRISFSAYLIHWPIIETFSCYFVLLFYSKMDFNLLVLINCFISLFIIAFFSYFINKYIEPLGYKFCSKFI